MGIVGRQLQRNKYEEWGSVCVCVVSDKEIKQEKVRRNTQT